MDSNLMLPGGAVHAAVLSAILFTAAIHTHHTFQYSDFLSRSSNELTYFLTYLYLFGDKFAKYQL